MAFVPYKIEINMRYLLILLSSLLFSCQSGGQSTSASVLDYTRLDTATFAGGCFWCVEASFEQIRGVAAAVSGYSGGTKNTANYELVSAGKTRHAETVQIYYDPQVITYEKLLEILFIAHDPTQLNRQGPDVGAQYRSVIFYHNEAQKAAAEAIIASWQPRFRSPIVTLVEPLEAFYVAEDYHQDYERKHPYNPYIMNVSRPKIDKVKREFAEWIEQ